MEKYKSIFIT